MSELRSLNWGALGVAMVLLAIGILLILYVQEIVGAVVLLGALVFMAKTGWGPTAASSAGMETSSFEGDD
ncbi:MAG: hypothetical protein M3340_08455 [Actinomycetota bacterium]|nr:hypothetical protein [Actinomycetota bacterium]